MSLAFIYDESTLLEALSDAIQRVLIIRNRVTLPGLGTFKREHEPARVAEMPDGSVELTPPTDSIVFDPEERGTSQTLDHKLADALSDILSISHVEIQKTYTELLQRMQEALKRGKSITLPGLGTLKPDHPLTFEPDPALQMLFSELPPTSSPPEETHAETTEKQTFPSFFEEEEIEVSLDDEELTMDVWLPEEEEADDSGLPRPPRPEVAEFTVEPTPEPSNQAQEPTEAPMAEEKPQGLSLTPPEHPDPSAAVTASAFYNMFRAHPDSPQAADALFWAAENYIKAGQIEQAKAVLLEFLNHFPHHPRAEEIRAALNLPPGPPPAPEPTPEPESEPVISPPPPPPPAPEQATGEEEEAWKPLAEAVPEPQARKTPKPPRPPQPPRTPARRRSPLPYVILSGILLVVVLGVLYFLTRSRPATAPEQPSPTVAETLQATPAPAVSPETTATASAEPAVPPTAAETFDPLFSSEGIILERDGYTWVVASVTDRATAERIAARYREMGYRVGVLTARRQGQTIYRVGIGQFSTIEEAQRARRQLPPDAPSDAWILRIR